MPDEPIHRPSADQRAHGVTVLHEALAMRQEVERELAEAGAVRSSALTEATQLLEQARLAAGNLQEQAEDDARRTVEQAREQAAGIIAQARQEADQVLSEAHADAVQFEAWARQDAHSEIRRELAQLRESIADRQGDLEGSLSGLQSAAERALTALDGTAWLSVSISDQDAEVHPPTSTPAPAPASGAGPSRGPRMSLVPSVDESDLALETDPRVEVDDLGSDDDSDDSGRDESRPLGWLFRSST